MKTKIHSLVIEGVIFCGSGLALLSYSLISYSRAFNKIWGQSPYLFPLIVALAMIGLSAWLIGEGVRAMKRQGRAGDDMAPQDAAAQQKIEAPQDAVGRQDAAPAARKESTSGTERAAKMRGVIAVLALCILYYLVLLLLKIPYITIGILSFQYTFSTFEVATLVFLAAMMAYMGVRKPLILTLVPIGTTLFLSIAFRMLLHVLLP